jgi:excisionase family DNA binding protein
MIKEAIANGQLPAKKIGRSWRVKRSCLDAYIDDVL